MSSVYFTKFHHVIHFYSAYEKYYFSETTYYKKAMLINQESIFIPSRLIESPKHSERRRRELAVELLIVRMWLRGIYYIKLKFNSFIKIKEDFVF